MWTFHKAENDQAASFFRERDQRESKREASCGVFCPRLRVTHHRMSITLSVRSELLSAAHTHEEGITAPLERRSVEEFIHMLKLKF